MVCECGICWIKLALLYGDVVTLLTWKNSDCVLVDVGCGSSPYLHEIKRHLFNNHNIKCKTIGIDHVYTDIEADIVIKDKIQNVKKFTGEADIVTASNVFTIMHSNLPYDKDSPDAKTSFKNKEAFKNSIMSCVRMLKPDGILLINIVNTEKSLLKKIKTLFQKYPDNPLNIPNIKIMNKKDATEHANMCHMKYFEECPHGLTITNDITQKEIRDYLPWLPVWDGKKDLKRRPF